MKKTDKIVITLLIVAVLLIASVVIAAINNNEPPIVLEPEPPKETKPPIEEEPEIEDDIDDEEDEVDDTEEDIEEPDPEPEPPKLPPKYDYSCTYGEAFRIYRDIWESETKYAIEEDWGQIKLHRTGTISLDKEAWSWLATSTRDDFLDRVIPALQTACNPVEIVIR